MKIGLKFWSTNNYYIKPALEAYKNGLYDYIELYSVPGSYNEFIKEWQQLDIPFIIHAPHFRSGMCLSDPHKGENNKKLIEESKAFANALNCKKIIFHLGIGGTLDEAIRQLRASTDERCVVENKPIKALDDLGICNGTTPDDIARVLRETGAMFCLDFGHAICAANSLQTDPIDFIRSFLELQPAMFHLTDGDYSSELDSHPNFGKGSFPLAEIVSLLSPDSMLTIETNKKDKKGLDDFVEDVKYLKNIIKQNNK